MRNVQTVLCFTLITTLACGDTLQARTPDENAVLAPLQAVLDGFATRNKSEILEQVMPDGAATLIREGKVLQFPLTRLVERVPDGTFTVDERIRHPLIRIDHDIAMIWASYVVLFDGKLHHCGTDIVNLIYQDGRWRIAAITDTSRKECARR
jgi:hypothetical protein